MPTTTLAPTRSRSNELDTDPDLLDPAHDEPGCLEPDELEPAGAPARDAGPIDSPFAADPLLASRRRPKSLMRRVLQDRDALLEEILVGRRHDLRAVAGAALALSALGGLGLGASTGVLQALSAAVKVPLITAGTLAVCFPAFYIFGVLRGSQIRLEETLRLFAVGLGLRGAILAALAPLLLFFASVGSPYGFLLVLGLTVFGVAEFGFLSTLERGVKILRAKQDAIDLRLCRAWSAVYLAVAAQLTWSLRPLIRHPDEPLALIGGRGSNMFTYFLENVSQLFTG